MMKKNNPDIRFRSYTDDWELRRLNDVAIYRNGKAHENDIEEVGDYVVVNSKFVSTSGKVKKYSNIQSEPLYKDEIAFVLSDVPNGKAIARTFLIDNNNLYSLNQRIAGINSRDETYPYFLNILMNRNPYFLRFDDGVKQTNLRKEDVESWEDYYPKYIEQTKIGTFFQTLDKLITLHQRELENYKLLKKGFLQKLFPVNGAVNPAVRFEGFTDAWELRRFKDLAKTRRGLIYKPEDVQDNGVRVLRSSNINEDTFVLKSDDIFVNPAAVNIEHVIENDILITSANGSSRLVGKHALINNVANIAVHGGFMLLATADNPHFTNAYMSSSWYSKFIHTYVSGGNGAIGNLSKSDLDSQKIVIANPDEQSKIGMFFQTLDNLITLHQRELESYKELKKGFLQKMFV